MTQEINDCKTIKHFNTPGHAHELTFSCYRSRPYLNDPVACEIFLDELQKSKTEHSFQLWAYVLMPTHVHLLIWPLNASYDISKILNEIKGRTAKRYRDHVQSSLMERFEEFMVLDTSKKRKVFRFWQIGGGFDRNLWSAKAITGSIRYIEANPVKKNLSSSPDEYRWSSAFARRTEEGLVPDSFNLPVLLLDPQC